MRVAQVFSEAVTLHQQGLLDLAEARYAEILAADPVHIDACHYLGLISFQRGQYEIAKVRITQAIRWAESTRGTAPAEFHINLGNALKRCGELQAALDEYLVAARERPDFSPVWLNVGLLYRDMGQLDAAIDSLARACQTTATRPQVLIELAECRSERGEDQLAIECYNAAVVHLSAVFPSAQKDEMLIRIARSLVGLGRHAPALKILEPLCDSQQNSVELLNVMGCALSGLGRLSEAIYAFQHARDLNRYDVRVVDNLACALKDAGRNDEAIALFREILKSGDAEPALWSNYLFSLLYSDTVSESEILVEHQRAAQFFIGNPVLEECAGSPSATSDRIRLAYLSGDLRNHPIAYFFAGILCYHNTSRFEVVVYDNSPTSDEWTSRLKEGQASWRKVRGLSDSQLAQLIRDDCIDVLIELSGHTAENRLAALSSHPAKVQVSYLGYPFSIGLPWIDWRIVDVISDPSGSDACSAEKLLRLSRSYYAYSLPADAPDLGELPALQNKYLTFGVCSNLAKVSPRTLDLWACIIRSFPGSKLYWRTRAFADHVVRREMLAALRKRGICEDNITLDGWAPHRERWLAFNQIDIALDTFPYNQATNTCEAAWMGVPTLSFAGDAHRSLMGASILGELGLSQWVVRVADLTSDAHKELARVATLFEVTALAALRGRLRAKVQQCRLADCGDMTSRIELACYHLLAGSVPPFI